MCPGLVVPATTVTLDEIDTLEVRLRELRVGSITAFAVVKEGADEGRALLRSLTSDLTETLDEMESI